MICAIVALTTNRQRPCSPSQTKEQDLMSTTTSNSTVIPTGTWAVDPPHSKVGFGVKHMGIATVRGEFTEFDGTLEIGEDLSSAKVYGTVKSESVDTNEPQRDDHLRSPAGCPSRA